MKVATCIIKGISPFQQSKSYSDSEKSGESKHAYEERTWKSRAHLSEDGQVVHPGNALKQALVCAASKKQESVAGKGKCKYKGFFESGIMIRKDLVFNKTTDDIKKVAVFGSSNGNQSGKGGTRVTKFFPTIYDWEAECEIVVLDETITEAVLKAHLEYAGIVAGLGTWRPQNGGDNGRFIISAWKYEEFKK